MAAAVSSSPLHDIRTLLRLIVGGVVSLLTAGCGATAHSPRLTISRLHLDAAPVAVAAAGGRVWVVVESRTSRAQLVELDPASGRPLASYTIGRAGPDFGAVTATKDTVWATAGNHLIRVGRGPVGVVIRRASLPGEGTAVTVGFGGAWVATVGASADALIRLDASRLSVERQIPLSLEPVALGTYDGSIWLASTGGLWRIAGSMLVPAVDPVSLPIALAASAGGVWIAEGDRLAVRVDRRGMLEDRVPLPFSPGAIAAIGDDLWVTDNCGCRTGRLAVVDESTRRVLARTDIGETPVGIAGDGTGAWVTTFADETLSHVTLR